MLIQEKQFPKELLNYFESWYKKAGRGAIIDKQTLNLISALASFVEQREALGGRENKFVEIKEKPFKIKVV